MAGCGTRSRKLVALLVLLGLLGGVVLLWVERAPLLAWLYIRQLAHADDSSRARWAERVADLGEAALPGVLDCLRTDTAPVCAGARAALEKMSQPWGPSDPRTVELAYQLGRDFAQLSPTGRAEVLALAAGWFGDLPKDSAAAPGLLSACTRMLAEAVSHPQPASAEPAILLCTQLLGQPDSTEVLSPAQDLVRTSLVSPESSVRLQAIRLALYPGMDLLDQIVALLRDPAAEVRRAALLAVGPFRDAVHDDSLLPSLHDSDPEVRRLCRMALRGRGLKPEYIELGRLLTDARPAMRLQVLDHLFRSPDLDPSLWLRRLSHDPSPAVRVAAMRAMAAQQLADVSDRLEQMAQSDPSPTVCQLARFYLDMQPRTPRPFPLLRTTTSPPTEGVIPAEYTSPAPDTPPVTTLTKRQDRRLSATFMRPDS